MDNVQIILYGSMFLIIFGVITHIFATMSGTSLFNLLSGVLKSDEKKTYKYHKIPDDKRFVLDYSSKNFRQMIDGLIIAGVDTATGKEQIRFHYGNDQLTDFTIPSDPAYFRIAEPSKLYDTAKLRVEIVDNDAYWKLKQRVDNITLYSKTLEKQLQDRMSSQETQLQKTVSLIKEEKKVAFGWTGSGQQTGLPYRPWSSFNRFGGYGGAGQGEEEQM